MSGLWIHPGMVSKHIRHGPLDRNHIYQHVWSFEPALNVNDTGTFPPVGDQSGGKKAAWNAWMILSPDSATLPNPGDVWIGF